MRTPVLISFVLCALAGCVAGEAGPSEAEIDGPTGKADDAERFPPVVFVAVDYQTLSLADETPSSVDGQPIGRPDPDDPERFREFHALVLRALNETDAGGALWGFSFGASRDGDASAMLARALDDAPFPVVLARSNDPHAAIYAGRATGHTRYIFDLQLVDGEPVPTAPGLPLGDFLDVHLGAPPLAVVGLEAWSGRDGLAAADCLAADFGTSASRRFIVVGSWQIDETVRALELYPRPIETISAADLLQGTAAIPDGALAVVGYDYAGGDVHALFPGEPSVPGGLGHAWALDLLVREGDACQGE